MVGGLFSYSWAQPESFAPPDGFFDFSAASLKEQPGDQSPRLSTHTGSPSLSSLLCFSLKGPGLPRVARASVVSGQSCP